MPSSLLNPTLIQEQRIKDWLRVFLANHDLSRGLYVGWLLIILRWNIPVCQWFYHEWRGFQCLSPTPFYPTSYNDIPVIYHPVIRHPATHNQITCHPGWIFYNIPKYCVWKNVPYFSGLREEFVFFWVCTLFLCASLGILYPSNRIYWETFAPKNLTLNFFWGWENEIPKLLLELLFLWQMSGWETS